MPDYGHDLLFGVFVPPDARQADAVLALARYADEAGLDLVSVQDHPYNPQFLDTWTLLTAIAAVTERVRVFPNVANLPLRPPAMLARQVASLDILSGGRAELGIGAGAFWDAIEAMGGPRRTPGESIKALREAIGVIRALWTQGHGTPGRGARVDGEYYELRGAKPAFPVHDVGIWVGSYKERMLRLTGELADGWLPSSPYAPPEQLAAMNAVIDAAALDAGRSPADVRRLYNIAGSSAVLRSTAGERSSCRGRRRPGRSNSPGWRSTRGSAASCSWSTTRRRPTASPPRSSPPSVTWCSPNARAPAPPVQPRTNPCPSPERSRQDWALSPRRTRAFG